MPPRPAVRTAAAASAALAAADHRFAALVDAHGPCRLGPKPRADARFTTLAVAIVSQQLASKAADTIWSRVVTAVGGDVTPTAFLQTPIAQLRAAGLSEAKTRSVLDLATRVADGRLELATLGRLPDEAVTAALTAVRGIGPWTADMFLIFALHRLDIWPVGDLGVRNGYARIHGLALAPTSDELRDAGERFRPFRSVAAWYCWRALETPR